jgi:hypothetical protein
MLANLPVAQEQTTFTWCALVEEALRVNKGVQFCEVMPPLER